MAWEILLCGQSNQDFGRIFSSFSALVWDCHGIGALLRFMEIDTLKYLLMLAINVLIAITFVSNDIYYIVAEKSIIVKWKIFV